MEGGISMSVIRSKRNIANTEYEDYFTKLYHFSEEQTSRVSKRRKKWLCKEINDLMNESYNLIMEVNENTFHRMCDEVSAKANIKSVLFNLYRLQRPLYILWNVEGTESKKMAAWCKYLQDECELLIKMTDLNYEYKFRILDHKAIEKVQFLKNMSELHRFIHGKVVNAPCKYDDSSGQLLINLVDSAFFSVVKANIKIPETHNEYVKREKCIARAISDLYKLQRQSLFYCNLMQYSDNVLREWSNYISTEIKLLNALKKSDKKRFAEL